MAALHRREAPANCQDKKDQRDRISLLVTRFLLDEYLANILPFDAF